MKLSRVIRISRPRFWIYELGPYMIGVLGAIFTNQQSRSELHMGMILLFAFYFLIPANIWIYGINDIYDYETDKLNPKKTEGYEALVTPKEQKGLWKWILFTTIPFILVLCYQQYQLGLMDYAILISFLVFLFFSSQYSADPIRAKSIPVFDSFFSAGHYIATAIFGYLLVYPAGDINRYYAIAGISRSMAMHAFSAVLDIQADKDAKLITIATFLGWKATIRACFGLYIVATILSYSIIGRAAIILGVIYCLTMLRAITLYGDEKKLFAFYKWFPWINTASGMILFFVVLLKII